MNNSLDDTIAAIATPPGRGGIAVVRVSGSETFGILDRVFSGGGRLSDADSHTVHFGRIIGSGGNEIDEVLVTLFRSPRSYTSEDMIEVGCHGGRVVAEEVLGAIMAAGARHAERGEFTKRAFLLGRVDLAQAEAVMQMVSAPSGRAVRVAAQQLKGVLSDKVNGAADKVVDILSAVEARLDFPEDIEDSYHRQELLSELDSVIDDAGKLSRTSEVGRRIQEGINVAIVGPPNAGKSSMFNLLLENDRAIVSDKPGTTRDFIRETIGWRGLSFNLIDTAGLAATADQLELEGMERTWRCIEASDVVMLVLDGTIDIGGLPELLRRLPRTETVTVLNKSDLGLFGEIRALLETEGFSSFEFSCVRGDPPDQLLDEIAHTYSGMDEAGGDLALVVNRRHSEMMARALDNLRTARDIVAASGGDDLASFELREALAALEAVTGRNLSGEVVDRVFDEFCVGK